MRHSEPVTNSAPATAPEGSAAEVDAEPPATAPVCADPAAGAPIPTLVAVILAVASGGAMLLSFPVVNLWYLAPVAVALLALAVHRRRFWAGFRLGGLAGLVFFVPLLHWTNIVGGAVAWLLLAVMEAAYIGLLGGAAGFASPVVDRRRWLWPLATAVLWVAQEAARDRTPFGGFPWGRLAFSQGDSPMLRYAVAGGAPLVSFAVALCGGLIALAVGRIIVPDRSVDRSADRGRTGAPGGWRPHLAAVGGPVAIAAIIALAALVVPTNAPHGRPIEVAIVQGNVPRLGLEFNAQRRAVLDNHVRGTIALAAQVKAGTEPQPDIVIWPENSSDVDPLISDDPDDTDAADAITSAADAIGVPILVGAVLEGPGADARNAAIVWLPNGGPQTGPHGMYVKRHPVPFAEYVPLRSLARKISSKVDLISHDFLAGDTPGVLTIGPATIGDVICFEVAYDGIVRDTVTGGAQLLAVQTNNADFNTAEARQQLAMVRLRAVEHGRDGLMVSTVGISGFVDSSGGVHQATGFNVPATELRQLHLGDRRTLATRLGPVPEYALATLALVLLVAAGWTRHRIRPPKQPAGPPTTIGKTTSRGDT
jgi:apolipoprotein N-acyltransferase